MGAKKKLNSAHLVGSLMVAGLLGAFTGSWPVFVMAVVVLLATSVYTGDIQR